MKIRSLFAKTTLWMRSLFNRRITSNVCNQPPPSRISLIIIDPILHGKSGRKLSEVQGWNNPDRLVNDFLQDLVSVSHGRAQYQIVERIQVDDYLQKEDGFRYTEVDYLHMIRTRHNIHQPDAVNYHSLLDGYEIIEKINRNQIDEVWTVSFPWAGFYESRMAGPGAYWCNAPPLPHTDAARRFVIMAFNLERGVGEMLESYGHRTESIMAHVYRSTPNSENLWEKFTRHEKSHPGRSEVGSMHYAPNSRRDYDWGNPSPVLSRFHTWRNFPDLSGESRLADCRLWGNGDIREHHRWWFSLIPHATGKTEGISNNWWEYILDTNVF